MARRRPLRPDQGGVVTPEAALARTTRLINEEYFGGAADTEAIASGLLGTTVRLAADEKNTSTLAGQAALVTAFQLTTRLGIGIELIVPEIQPVRAVPPLRAPRLRAALIDLGADLIPGVMIRQTAFDAKLAFVFGDSADHDANGALAQQILRTQFRRLNPNFPDSRAPILCSRAYDLL